MHINDIKPASAGKTAIRRGGAFCLAAGTFSLFFAPATARAQDNPPPVPTPTVPAPATPTADPSQDPATTSFEMGLDAYRKNDLDKANTPLTKAVTEHPENGDAQAILGFLLAKQGQYDAAVEHLDKATTLKTTMIHPEDSPMNLGKALLMRPNHTPDDTNRAIAAFQEAVKRAPKSADAEVMLGFGYVHADQYDKAAAAYSRATVLNPKNAQAWKNLGVALRHLGQNDDAVNALQKASTLNSGDADTWASLGELDLQRGENAGAQNALETARKLDPKNVTVLVELGILYSHQTRPAEAAEAYGTAADQIDAAGSTATPLPTGIDLAKLRYNQGVTLAASGKKDEAAAAYDKALSINPRYPEALLNSGTLLFESGKTEEAINRFRTAGEAAPDSGLAWKNLAAASAKQKDITDETMAWRKIAALEPKNYDARDNLVTLLLQANPTSDEAIKYYKQMAALHPQSPDPLIGLGLLYERQVETVSLASQKQAKLMLALQTLQSAIERDPKSAVAYNDLGVVHERRGEMPEAMADYRKAISLDAALSDAKKNLARFSGTAPAKSAPVKPPSGTVKKP